MITKLMSILVCCVGLVVCAHAAEIAPTHRWYVDTERLGGHFIDIKRGETIILEPVFRNYGNPLNLTYANTVELRYKSANMTTNYYSKYGWVESGTAGVCRIRWDASCEGTNSTYDFDIAVSASSSTVVRTFGLIQLRGSVTDNGGTNVPPRALQQIDCALVTLLNVGSWPFLSSYDLTVLQAIIASWQNGTGDIDARNLRVRGTPTIDNWPDVLITNVVNAGTSGTSGEVSRVAGTVAIRFPLGGGGGGGGSTNLAGLTDVDLGSLANGDRLIYDFAVGKWTNSPAEGEGLNTNRLYWIVNGETIGYVDTNGITMLKGSLRLYEEDLNCNVRAYDGSKAVPSMSFYSSPTFGWYRKSTGGTYVWAHARSTNDIFWINDSGIYLAGTSMIQGVRAPYPQTSTTDSPTTYTPRWIGDELVIHTTTQRTYRAYGLTTNSWVSP